MRILFLMMIFVYALYSADFSNCGDLPTWKDLGMNESDYFYLSGLSGLICGSIFTFLITR